MKNQFEQNPGAFWMGRVVQDCRSNKRFGHITGFTDLRAGILIMVKWSGSKFEYGCDPDELVLL